MRSRKALLKKAKLYVILDAQVNAYPKLFDIAKQSIAGGVGIIQLRDKTGTAREILAAAAKLSKIANDKALFIVNDRIDIALLAGTDGVHLGQEDVSVMQARAIVPRDFLIGASCQTLEHVKAAEKSADYIGFGSIFKTLTKPQRRPMDQGFLKRVLRLATIPVFAIGGIKFEHIPGLKVLGVNRFAVCRDICLAKDVRNAARKFRLAVDA